MLSVFAVCVDDYLCKEMFDAKLKQLYYFVKRVSLVFTKCLFPKLIAKDLFIARFLWLTFFWIWWKIILLCRSTSQLRMQGLVFFTQWCMIRTVSQGSLSLGCFLYDCVGSFCQRLFKCQILHKRCKITLHNFYKAGFDNTKDQWFSEWALMFWPDIEKCSLQTLQGNE